jgi:hypothetical protein
VLTPEKPIVLVMNNLESFRTAFDAVKPREGVVPDGTSLWFRPLWRNGQITVEFAPLPSPVENEPLGDWTRRWIDAYLAKLEAAMRGSPENLGLFSGIWGNVNRTVLRLRQVREARRELGKTGSQN